MIDIHTHILPGVDDGPDSMEVSLKIVRAAREQGITKMVATPHYLEEGYQLTPEETGERVAKLQEAVDEAGVKVEILPGAEAYLTADLGKRVQDGLVTPINHSRYILVEFPMTYVPAYVNNVFYDLKIMGYTPIICHPERYSPIREKPDYLYEWLQDGILAQVNASSLLGVYGSRVRKAAEILVRNNLVQLIASDAHSTGRRKVNLKAGVSKLKGIVGNYAENYLKNAENVITDTELDYAEPIRYEKSSGLLKRVRKFIW
ncbi:MAG: CpsB/CapC family capsule biosynthesis tyrosine phosphatase [Halanaerobium sp.]|nr:CpsB/CapC family capsule biosynthesis tyrosine phosphatase [Halanaerobium sp.]